MATLIGEMTDGCEVLPDGDDGDRQTLLVSYPTLYPDGETAYVSPRVKIEAGVRSELEPNVTCAVRPYVADDFPDWPFDVGDVATLAAKRTYWEKLLILHGVHCGYRDEKRLPADKDRISRHYYDAATMTASEIGDSALSDEGLLDAVRNHNLVAFRQARKRFEEAVPGAAGSSAGTACGDRTRLPVHAGHDPRRRPGVRMDHGPASPRGNRDKPNVTAMRRSRIHPVANVARGWLVEGTNHVRPPRADFHCEPSQPLLRLSDTSMNLRPATTWRRARRRRRSAPGGGAETLETFTILTTAANDIVAPIHHSATATASPGASASTSNRRCCRSVQARHPASRHRGVDDRVAVVPGGVPPASYR